MGFYKSQNLMVKPDGQEIRIVPYKHINFIEMIGRNCFFQIEDDGRFKRILNLIPTDV